MELIKKYYEKYEEIIKYLFFGVLTTIVNFSIYFLLAHILGSDGMLGAIINLIAIAISIMFAYVTNRKFVFKSKATGSKAIMKEMVSFVSCRIASSVVDELIYIIGCTVLGISDLIVKLFSQVVITILNYIFSKLIIFKKK